MAFPILTDLDNNNSGVYIDSSTVVTMSAAPSMLVLLLVALHLQSHHAKYYLVQTDGEAAGVSKKSLGNPKHVVSSSKTKASRVRRKNKKTGMVRRQDKKTSKVRHRNKEPGKVGRRNKALLHPVASGPLRAIICSIFRYLTHKYFQGNPPGLKDNKKFKKDYRKSGSDYMNTMSSEVGPSGEHTMYTRPRPNPQPNPTGEHTMSMYTLGGGTESTLSQYH